MEHSSLAVSGFSFIDPPLIVLTKCRVFTLSPHTPASLEKILSNALSILPDPAIRLPPDLIPFLADVADGDARQALNGLELALKVCETPLHHQTTLDSTEGITVHDAERDKMLMDAVRKGLRKGYDRSGEERYDMISALHKSLRGSDGSAAMYWLARWAVSRMYIV
jgi:putative ATPase